MAAYVKAAPPSAPDLDVLDELWARQEAIVQRMGSLVATDIARGTVAFHRLKAAPKLNRTELRAQVAGALGPTLSAILFGVATKAAPADEFDQLAQQIADAARAKAMAAGSDQKQIVAYLQNVLSQLSRQQAQVSTKQTYDPARDPMAVIAGADQVGRKR